MLRYREGPFVENAYSEGGWCVAEVKGAGEDLSFISGGMDGVIKGWKYGDESLAEAFSVEAHALGVVSVATSAKGDFAASSSLDGYLKLWTCKDGKLKEHCKEDTNIAEAWDLAFSPDGRQVAGGSHSFRVNIWSVGDDLERIATLQSERNSMVMSIAYTPDGSTIAAGSTDGSVQLFDVESGKVRGKLSGHVLPVRSLSFSPSDSSVLISGADDQLVNVYDAKSMKLVSNLSGHAGFVLSVDANEDDKRIATGSADKTVKVRTLPLPLPHTPKPVISTDTHSHCAVFSTSLRSGSAEPESVCSHRKSTLTSYGASPSSMKTPNSPLSPTIKALQSPTAVQKVLKHPKTPSPLSTRNSVPIRGDSLPHTRRGSSLKAAKERERGSHTNWTLTHSSPRRKQKSTEK